MPTVEHGASVARGAESRVLPYWLIVELEHAFRFSRLEIIKFNRWVERRFGIHEIESSLCHIPVPPVPRRRLFGHFLLVSSADGHPPDSRTAEFHVVQVSSAVGFECRQATMLRDLNLSA